MRRQPLLLLGVPLAPLLFFWATACGAQDKRISDLPAAAGAALTDLYEIETAGANSRKVTGLQLADMVSISIFGDILINGSPITETFNMLEGTAIDITLATGPSPDTVTFDFDPTELGGTTWHDGSSVSLGWVFDLTNSDPSFSVVDSTVSPPGEPAFRFNDAVLMNDQNTLFFRESTSSGADIFGLRAAASLSGSYTASFNITGNCSALANGGALTINSSNEIVCENDDGGAGSGDNISVDGVAATDANFISTGQSVAWTLNTGPTPDEITANVDTTQIDTPTWSDGSFGNLQWTFDVVGTNPVVDFSDNQILFSGGGTGQHVDIDNNEELRFREAVGNGTNYIGLEANAALASNYVAALNFTGDCTGNDNGGKLTINGSNQIVCADDAGDPGLGPFVDESGDTMTGDLVMDDGVGNSPAVRFVNQVNALWNVVINNTDDDLIISSDARAAESVVTISNPGSGLGALEVEGNITAVLGSFTGTNVTSGANPGHTHTGVSISALDAGDTTTGTFADARVDGTLEEDEINHDNLLGFVSDEHIAHSGVALTAGAGLSGGGDISASRSFATASGEAAFLADGGVTSLTCGASNQGKMQVMDDGEIEYCDGATTSVLQAGVPTQTGLTWNVTEATCTGDGNGGALTINGSSQIICSADDGGAGGSGDAIEIEDGDDGGTFTAIDTTARFEDQGDINFTFTDGGAGGPDTVTATVRANSVALTTDTTGNYLSDVTAGLGLSEDITPGEGASGTVSIDHAQTLAGDPALAVDQCIHVATATGGGFLCEGSTADTQEQLYLLPDVNGADTTARIATDNAEVTELEGAGLSITAGTLDVDHDAANNFVADEHVAHSGVTLTAGAGLSGGGTIDASRTFDTASTEAAFLTDGGAASLTCGGGNQGKMQVMDDGALQYCDGATTSVLADGFLDADGVDDDVPESGDFGAGADLDADGSVSDNVALGGDPTATTAAANDNDTSIATTAYVQTELTAYASDSVTFTNKTIDGEGTGNIITLTSEIYVDAASCIGATASNNWDDDGAGDTAPTAACNDTGTLQRPSADFSGSAVNSFIRTMRLPSDWTGAVDLTLRYVSTAASPTGNVEWDIQTVCRAAGETWDGTYNAAQTITDAQTTQNVLNDATQSSVTMTGCSASEDWTLKVSRDGTNDSSNDIANLLGAMITLRRAQ